MKRPQSMISNLITGALVFGSLGISGLIGAVTTFADEGAQATPAADLVETQIPAPLAPPVSQSLLARANRSSRDTDLGVSRQRLGVRLSKDGMISGRLNVSDSITGAHVSAEKLNIKFVQRGSVVVEVKPGVGGVFHTSGLNPGVYSMIASGSDGFFACGVIVSAYAGEAEAASTSSLQIDASVVHPSNVAVARKLITSRVASSGKSPAQRRTQVSAAGLSRSVDDAPPLHTPVLTVGADGKVLTRINELDEATAERRPAAGGTVYLIQRGVVRGRYQVADDGSFYAPGIVGGQYSLVATSQRSRSAFAAIGVIIEEAGSSTGTVKNGSSRISVQPAKVTKLQGGSDIDMVPSTDFDSTDDPANTTQDQQAGGGGFGSGGGGGGGFGGGGGGLGLGGLAAIGAAAGIAAAIANNKNNNAASPKK